MFYKHADVQYYQQALCRGHSPEEIGLCMTKSFKNMFLSSNNPEFFRARNGYILCKNNTEYNLMPVGVSSQERTSRPPLAYQSSKIQYLLDTSSV